MYGARVCQKCGVEYYPGEGGLLYCTDCRRKVRTEAERERKRVLKLANDPGWKGSLRLPTDRLPDEVTWKWACGVCGMKHRSEEQAVLCCRLATLEATTPYFRSGGNFIVWKGEIITRDQLASWGVLGQTTSPLALTLAERILVARAAALLGSIQC